MFEERGNSDAVAFGRMRQAPREYFDAAQLKNPKLGSAYRSLNQPPESKKAGLF
jgi:hypothetical protein